jgi:hypothetical protein
MACCVVVLLAGVGGLSARASEGDRYSAAQRVRFVSLAEARALALEQGPVDPAKKDRLSHRSVTAADEGMLVARGEDAWSRSRPEYDRDVNQMLLNVETAYWNLYGSYWALYSREAGVRMAREVYDTVAERYRAGAASLADTAQARGQYDLFRAQRLQAIDTVQESESRLRALLGLAAADGTRLAPCDCPAVAEDRPDWEEALKEAYANRPEIKLARRELAAAARKAKEHEGASDEASEPAQEDPPARRARLKLAQAYLAVQDAELSAERFLHLNYRKLSLAHEQIKANRYQREAFATQMRSSCQGYLGGRTTLDVLLEAQRFWADALSQEQAAIVSFNNARCAFAFARGKIQEHAHVTVSDKPAPEGASSAARCERERTRARIRCEQSLPPDGLLTAAAEGPRSLPALWKVAPPMADAAPLPKDDTETGKAEESER